MRRPALVIALAAISCARMFPDKVATGVARLSVRNAAVLTGVINADTNCGFEAPSVKNNPTLIGEVGHMGMATWTVSNCRVDFGELTEVAKDCNDTATRIGGAATVSATRTITGTLTGNPAQPIVPLDSGAVSIDVTATFDQFIVRTTDAKTALTIHAGGMSWNAAPRLAVSASQGVCAVPTNDVLLDGITYTASTVTIDNDGSLIDVDVDGSSFSAQIGKGVEKENALWGSVSVWGGSQPVPEPGDNGGLDPDYDGVKFEKSWACGTDFAQPISFTCPTLDEAIGEGASQLTILLFGRLADIVNSDTSCGFASAGVAAGGKVTGTVGDRGGQVTLNIASSCQIHFSTPTVVDSDCNGLAYKAEGTALITGTKVVKGIVSGDPKQPIVPTTRDPATLTLSMQFMDFTVTDSNGRGMKVKSGALSGAVSPRVAKDTTNGVCSITTPVSTYSGITWSNGDALVMNAGNTFAVNIASSNLDAQNGSKDGRTNTLSGTLTANGQAIKVPSALDPSYDQVAFDKSYACLPNMVVVQSDDECSLYDQLGQAAARLLIQTAGAAASRVNGDKHCGFNNWLVKLSPSNVMGNDGEQGSMTWHIDDCDVGSSDANTYDTDCLGATDTVQGTMSVSATRTVTGERQVILGLVDSITPQSPDAVTIQFDGVSLAELAVWHVEAGASAPEGKLTFHDGTITGTVQPVTAERASKPGTYDVATPVAKFTSLSLGPSRATLVAGGKTFNLNIGGATLNAMNGRRQGQGNTLSGTIMLDGKTFTLPAAMPLNPHFAQSSFDAAYACTTDMMSVVPAQ